LGGARRRQRLPLLVERFIRKYSNQFNKRIESVPAQVMQILTTYDWPGNIRELQNAVGAALS
jgi:transcriptional regulator with PAS, ATPase and Fis domain